MAHWNIVLIMAVIIAVAWSYGSLAEHVSDSAKIVFFVFVGCFILAFLVALAMEVGFAVEEQLSKRPQEKDKTSC